MIAQLKHKKLSKRSAALQIYNIAYFVQILICSLYCRLQLHSQFYKLVS